MQAIEKWKASLNFDGSKMEQRVHYDQSYTPMASWSLIHLVMALAIALNWHFMQVDYVLAFPQALLEWPVYMQLPNRSNLDEGKTMLGVASMGKS